MLSRLAPLLYVKISPQRLTVRNVRTGAELADVPEVAVRRAPGAADTSSATILAFGANARIAATSQACEVANPFDHPRTLMGDFTLGQYLLKVFIRQAAGASWFKLAPVVVLHPLGSPEGGFTQVELRGFREMALGAGASAVVVWTGREMTDDEVQAKAAQGPGS